MKLYWQTKLFQSTIISTFLASTPSVSAQTFDYSLLFGEWSQPGMCDEKRFIYTADGSYSVKEKVDNSNWQTTYEGIYVIKPEIDSIVISEESHQGGFLFSTLELTEWTYRSEEPISTQMGEVEQVRTFEYEKCID